MFSAKIIKKEICPYLKFGHQKNTKVELYQVIKVILYRLKTGCQWRELPMNCFFVFLIIGKAYTIIFPVVIL